ncbi:hypothetical protein [Nocardia sp. NPDC051570]|uniref:hypothetical protein n=1 Tax=Nocardia sp. NPDC051570 TaxID=3364324 RepID=UPI003799B22B
MKTIRLLAAVGMAAGCVCLNMVTANAAPPGGDCLWDGGAHQQGSSVVAGGYAYTCGTDGAVPAWSQGAPTSVASNVPNPGAQPNPAGLYSEGARQPGTDYDDYCSGDQLIPGVGDVFEAVPEGGGLYWKSVGSISSWSFDPGVSWPTDSTRSSSMCNDGQLM